MKLLRISRDVMALSLLLMVGGLYVGFGLEHRVSLQFQVLGHTAVMLAAISLKLGYILRLEGLAILARQAQASPDDPRG